MFQTRLFMTAFTAPQHQKGGTLFSATDLKLLRAAMKYFDEEFSPHDADIMRPYFDAPTDSLPTPAEIAELRRKLDSCRPAFAVCDQEMTRTLDPQLFQQLQPALTVAQAKTGTVLTVWCTV